MNKILRLVLFAVASLIVASAALAVPSIDTAEVCIDGSNFGFVVELTETGPADPIRVRIDAKSDPFVTPTERISINFDTVDGVVDIAAVETFGTPDFDHWQDGAIPAADLTVIDLGGGSWRVEGFVPNGTEPLALGDVVAFISFRSASGTTVNPNVPVASCDTGSSSLVTGVNLDDGTPWSPDAPGGTVSTNGLGVVVKHDQLIDVMMTIDLNGADEWRCTEANIVNGIFVSEAVDHADSMGPEPAFANFLITAPPAAGVYDLQLMGYPNDDCTGGEIARIAMLGAIQVISKSNSEIYRELVRNVAEKSELQKKVVRVVLTALRDVTSVALANEKWVMWDGIGIFEVCGVNGARTVCFRSEREVVQHMKRAMKDVFREMAADPDQFDFTPIPLGFEAEISAFDERVANLLVSHVPDFVGYMWFALTGSGGPEGNRSAGGMTKSEMVNQINVSAADKGVELTQEMTEKLLDYIYAELSRSINHEQRFSYPGFGTFTVKHRKAREGRNPRTGKPVKAPAAPSLSFKPKKTLKDRVN